GAGLQLRADFLGAAGRAAVASELAWDGTVSPPGAGAEPYVGEGGVVRLRKAMALAWRCMLAWLVVLALFVIAGFVSCPRSAALDARVRGHDGGGGVANPLPPRRRAAPARPLPAPPP